MGLLALILAYTGIPVNRDRHQLGSANRQEAASGFSESAEKEEK